MADPIFTDYGIEALKTAASWPGADRDTLVTLATVLAGTGADAEGATFFGSVAASQPDQVLPLEHALRQAGLTNPQVTIEQAEAITRDPNTGKVNRFIPLRGLLAQPGTPTPEGGDDMTEASTSSSPAVASPEHGQAAATGAAR